MKWGCYWDIQQCSVEMDRIEGAKRTRHKSTLQRAVVTTCTEKRPSRGRDHYVIINCSQPYQPSSATASSQPQAPSHNDINEATESKKYL